MCYPFSVYPDLHGLRNSAMRMKQQGINSEDELCFYVFLSLCNDLHDIAVVGDYAKVMPIS